MATPSLSQASLFQPKPSLLNPNTLQNQNANSRLFAHHNHLSITLPLKTRNGLVSNSKASLTVQPNVNSTVPIKKCDSPIIVIDNYDSFTYNPENGSSGGNTFLLVPRIYEQYMGEVGCYFEVYRNDEIMVDELKRMNPRGILISPGLGKVVRSPSGVMHGKSSLVYYDEKQEDNLFAGLSKFGALSMFQVFPNIALGTYSLGI
ncbi:anthranilate synthase beta subunit 1, chloroplastic-like [Castanea sativa]|uniref:anthranilate synthase beta subunit 1, chloroplastic-like n=1 Tax=Castanea sativa TaxID=21020 RepID=UPI003F654675